MPVNCQRVRGGKKLRYVGRMCDRDVAHDPPRTRWQFTGIRLAADADL